MPPSLSCAFAATVYEPQAANEVTNPLLPNAPKPEPVSNAQVKPAAVSGTEGSVAAPVNVTGCPVSAFAEEPMSDVIVGAMFVTFTVACATVDAPSASVT